MTDEEIEEMLGEDNDLDPLPCRKCGRLDCDGCCPIPVRDGKDLTTSNQENP